MQNFDEIDALLIRYLQKECNSEEQERIEKWILQQPANQKYFKKLRSVHLQLKCTVQSEEIRGNFSGWKAKLPHPRRWLKWYQIAALILLFLGTGLSGFYIYHSSIPSLRKEKLSTVAPGTSRAVLHLSSGQSIEVQKFNEEFKEKDGTLLHISENGSLSYTSTLSHERTEKILNKLEIPRGGEFKLLLSEGTEIWLNSETELQYPPTFTGKERIVHLKGEAYFKVAPNPESPFIVKIGETEVKVYGTQFNINTHNKGKIETVLVSGKISFLHNQQETLLKPSQKAEYLTSSGQVKVKEVNVLPYIAWKQGFFIFHDESLESIMEKLSRWYDLEVFYLHPETKLIRLSGTLERYKNVKDLLYHFEKISPARFTVKGQTVTIE